MAKVVDIEKLKPLLKGVLTEENEATFIEGLLGIAEDYDEAAINSRIDEAVASAKAEEQKAYSAKLHDMFFGNAKPEGTGESIDDSKTDPEINGGTQEVADIFEEVK